MHLTAHGFHFQFSKKKKLRRRRKVLIEQRSSTPCSWIWVIWRHPRENCEEESLLTPCTTCARTRNFFVCFDKTNKFCWDACHIYFCLPFHLMSYSFFVGSPPRLSHTLFVSRSTALVKNFFFSRSELTTIEKNSFILFIIKTLKKKTSTSDNREEGL